MTSVAAEVRALTSRVRADQAKLKALQAKCPHGSVKVTENVSLDTGVHVRLQCAECELELGLERRTVPVCLKDQTDMEAAPRDDKEAQAEMSKALDAIEKPHYYNATAWRCPKCRSLEIVVFYDR